MEKAKTNWKELCYELADKLQFAMGTLDHRGTGLVMNMETGECEIWQRYFAKSLEKVPGTKIDWDAVDALSLPAKQKRAYFNKLRKQQAAKQKP